jgi:hypothetical protein
LKGKSDWLKQHKLAALWFQLLQQQQVELTGVAVPWSVVLWREQKQ